MICPKCGKTIIFYKSVDMQTMVEIDMLGCDCKNWNLKELLKKVAGK